MSYYETATPAYPLVSPGPRQEIGRIVDLPSSSIMPRYRPLGTASAAANVAAVLISIGAVVGLKLYLDRKQ